ncbi:MAG: hypothetical protein K5705_03650 [Oscillospiraceae bacterium]|nr:hypothetical protein [Oscillospiraceae bacterium]MCR4759356.1 hypothetical protein [Oscillospiraceae bacterium]
MKVRFHLPDFARLARFNLLFISMLESSPELFRDGVEIASVYGAFPPSIWNGGRLQYGTYDKNFIRGVIRAYQDKGIPLRFTFTNPMLEEKHLSDPFCNMIMRAADNGLNECIVFSPLLEDYIRKNYPNYKLTSSTCKRITDAEQLYSEFEKDYHIIVLDYDLNHETDILEKIPHKEKCEILVNPCCNPNCPNRSMHYQEIGLEQIAVANHYKRFPNTAYHSRDFMRKHPEFAPVFSCNCETRTLFDITKLKNHITPDEIWNKYVPMGFTQFKIEGRTFDLFNLLEHYLYYMAKPERKDEARLSFLRNLMLHRILDFYDGSTLVK